jgi:hypothetical protein
LEVNQVSSSNSVGADRPLLMNPTPVKSLLKPKQNLLAGTATQITSSRSKSHWPRVISTRSVRWSLQVSTSLPVFCGITRANNEYEYGSAGSPWFSVFARISISLVLEVRPVLPQPSKTFCRTSTPQRATLRFRPISSHWKRLPTIMAGKRQKMGTSQLVSIRPRER